MTKSHKINCACLDLLCDIVRHSRHNIKTREITITPKCFDEILRVIGAQATIKANPGSKLIKANKPTL